MIRDILYTLDSPYRAPLEITGFRFGKGEKTVAIVGAIRGHRLLRLCAASRHGACHSLPHHPASARLISRLSHRTQARPLFQRTRLFCYHFFRFSSSGIVSNICIFVVNPIDFSARTYYNKIKI